MEMPDVGNIEKEESGITIDECSDTISDKDVLVVNSSEQSSIHDGQGYGGDLDSCTSSATTETDGEIKQSNYRASFTTFNPAPALQQASSIGVFLMSTLRLDTDTDSSTLRTESSESAQADPYAVWGDVLANWEETSKKRKKLLRQMVYQGIPDKVRCAVWPKLSDAEDPSLKDEYRKLMERDSPFVRIISRDLPRTFPDHDMFKDPDGAGQESLLNILKAYSLYDREVGYCQGSPFIAGLLLMQMPEEDAFCVFVRVMQSYSMRDLFKPSMAALNVCLHILDTLLQEHDSELFCHFQDKGLLSTMYASSWFLTLFASTLTLEASFRLMDMFLCDGMDAMFRVSLSILLDLRDELLKSDMAGMLTFLQGELRTHYNREDHFVPLFEKSFQLKISHKRLVKISKEYQSREKASEEASENEVLRGENAALVKRIAELEAEMSSMTSQLVSGKLSHAEEVENEVKLRKNVAIARRQLKEKLTKNAEEREQHSSQSPTLMASVTDSKQYMGLLVSHMAANSQKRCALRQHCQEMEKTLTLSKVRESELADDILALEQLQLRNAHHASTVAQLHDTVTKLKEEVAAVNALLARPNR